MDRRRASTLFLVYAVLAMVAAASIAASNIDLSLRNVQAASILNDVMAGTARLSSFNIASLFRWNNKVLVFLLTTRVAHLDASDRVKDDLDRCAVCTIGVMDHLALLLRS